MFENLAKERIVCLRNAIWTHLNQLSQQCVTNDEVGARQRRKSAEARPFTPFPPLFHAQLYEEVRKSLEQCDVQKDIEHFVNLRRTGDKPPGMSAALAAAARLLNQ